MKSLQRLTGKLLAILMVAACSAQAAEQGIAKVVNIRGAARYMTAENPTWRPLKNGAVLKQGTVVQTAADSYIDLVLNNASATASDAASLGAVESPSANSTSGVAAADAKSEQDALRIYENTVLGLDKLTVTQTGADRITDTQLDLKAGRILGSVKKLSAPSKYEIKIPNGVAGVRGTIYTLSSDGVLTVLTGSVVLAYVGADGVPVTREVRAGQQYDAKSGQTTTLQEADRRRMIREARALRIGPNTPPTTFAVDQTIYHVSPVQGHNGLGNGPQ